MPAGYLVPSWILECYMLNNPKVDKLSEHAGVRTLVINAQTGEMLDWFDTSHHGRGDGRYRSIANRSWKHDKLVQKLIDMTSEEENNHE